MTKMWVLIEADLHMEDPIGDTPVLGVFSSRELAQNYLAEQWFDPERAATIAWSDGQTDDGGWDLPDHWVGLLPPTPDEEGGLFQITAFNLDDRL